MAQLGALGAPDTIRWNSLQTTSKKQPPRAMCPNDITNWDMRYSTIPQIKNDNFNSLLSNKKKKLIEKTQKKKNGSPLKPGRNHKKSAKLNIFPPGGPPKVQESIFGDF